MDMPNLYHDLITLLTLTLLEIILGVDNLVFIAAASNRLPPHQQKMARKLGLLFALATRLGLLASAVWIMSLQKPWFTVATWSFSGRDILLLLGGLFLLYKATAEIHAEFYIHEDLLQAPKFAGLTATILQIAIFDLVFSLDSILTAIGLTQNFPIMACAITIAIIVMMFGSESTSRFIQQHPSVRMLAWSFLLLIGVALIADSLHFHIPRGYVYFAVCFSLFVEVLNSSLRSRRKKKLANKQVSMPH